MESRSVQENQAVSKIMIIDRSENNQPDTTEIAGLSVSKRIQLPRALVKNKEGCEKKIRRISDLG